MAGTRPLAGRVGTHTLLEESEWTDREAGAVLWEEGAGAGVMLSGCEGWRCYSAFISGPAADLRTSPEDFRTLLAGIHVDHLPAPAGGIEGRHE